MFPRVFMSAYKICISMASPKVFTQFLGTPMWLLLWIVPKWILLAPSGSLQIGRLGTDIFDTELGLIPCADRLFMPAKRSLWSPTIGFQDFIVNVREFQLARRIVFETNLAKRHQCCKMSQKRCFQQNIPETLRPQNSYSFFALA